MNTAPRRRTSGIDRTLQVMDVLTERQKPMSAYELAKATGAPVSSIYRIIDELVERDMLSRTDNSLIWLGPRLMRYGLVYRSRIDMFSEAKREMHALSKQTGETIQLCTRDENMMVVIGMADGGGHLRVASDVGTRVPLNWTASGRLLLGHLDDEVRLAAFRACTRPSETGTAETNPANLSKQSLADFQARIAIQVGNSEYSVACIAAPIRDTDGNCQLTLSIVLSEQRAIEEQGTLIEQVQRAAANVERAIGRQAA